MRSNASGIRKTASKRRSFLLLLLLTALAAWLVTRSAPASGQVLEDNFDDNITSAAAWVGSVIGTGPTITETNRRVEITFPADSMAVDMGPPFVPAFGAGYSFRCQLRGDFDVQVDYSLLAWPAASGALLGLSAFPPSPGRGINITRGSRTFGEKYESNVGVNGEPPYIFVPTSDLVGTLRITRVGDLGTSYYLGSAGWVSVTSGQVSTSDVPLFAGGLVQPSAALSGLSQRLVKVALDNFIVNQGELVGCEVCADATAPVTAAQPKLTIGKLQTPPGDDTLSFKGSLTLPFPFTDPLDPLTNGVRLRITDTSATVLNAAIPGGAFATPPGSGWKVNKKRTKWTYQDKTATPLDGISKVVIEDKSSKIAGLVKFSVTGKRGSYLLASDPPPLQARVDFGPVGGRCGDTSFSSCAFNRSGSTLKCK